ncbi:hypothetical protein ACJJTC_013584 [Scirpophaga incertulas]
MFCSSKLDKLGAYKELGQLEEDFNSIAVNGNGKLVAFVRDNDFNLYSTLGMRKRFSDEGKDLHFFGQDGFLYVKDREMYTGRKNEIISDDIIKDKAISFLENIGHHNMALSYCADENQAFEILIKLGRLDEALKSVNSPIKYEK